MIHGDTLDLRTVAGEVIAQNSGEVRACRYAMCGRGDLVVAGDEGGHGVSPRGCGHRLCPRCQRRRGARIAQRCIAWLAAQPHGWLYSFTLTQRAREGEALADAKRRMERWVQLYTRRLREAGMRGGLLTVHIVWSSNVNGWHYHVHGVVELATGLGEAWLADLWCGLDPHAGRGDLGAHVRELAPAGPAMTELADDDGDLDFWREASSAAARAVQYPVRDMLQGVSAWRLGGAASVRACCVELVRHASAWKVHRSMGRWRKSPPPAATEATAEGAGQKAGAPAGEMITLGTVDGTYRAALAGVARARAVFEDLERGCRNDGDFGRRLVSFCRRVTGCQPQGDT